MTHPEQRDPVDRAWRRYYKAVRAVPELLAAYLDHMGAPAPASAELAAFRQLRAQHPKVLELHQQWLALATEVRARKTVAA